VPDRPEAEDLSQLYETLSPEQRDELLQCLLIAASNGGEAMVEVLEQAFLRRAVEEACEKDKSFNPPQV